MRARSETWVKLAQGDFNFEAKAWIGDTVYTEITAPKINRALMNSPLSVGNCFSSTLALSIMTDDVLDSKVPIIIKGRLTNGKETSEYLPFGTFYINRKTNCDGIWTVSCYDAMLKANQKYLSDTDTSSADWPKTMAAVVSEIASRIGVRVDPRTLIRVGSDYVVPYPVGLTMNQVLGYIGGCHGGNWHISEDDTLRLVPLVTSPPAATASVVANNEVTPDSDIPNTYYITDDAGKPIVTTDDYYLVWADESRVDAYPGLEYIDAVLGPVETGQGKTVVGILMTNNTGDTFTAGNTSGAGVIKIEGNPYATQNICNDLYQKYNGLVYESFSASKAIYDPALEMGDQVAIGTITRSVIYTAVLNLDVGFTADISAPYSEELDDEYPHLTGYQKSTYSSTQTASAVSLLSLEEESEPTTVPEETARARKAESDLWEAIDGLLQLIIEQAETIDDLKQRLSNLENNTT